MSRYDEENYERMTPDELRAHARESYKRREESWERSDTDGFLSQWASDMTGRKYNAMADLKENGGMVEVRALFDAETGEVASTHSDWGQWGPYWVLNDKATEKYGKRFFSESKANTSAKRHATHKAKGFTIGRIKVKGYVTIAGSGTGLSGAANAYVTTLPVIAELRAGNFEIVTTDLGPDQDKYITGEEGIITAKQKPTGEDEW